MGVINLGVGRDVMDREVVVDSTLHRVAVVCDRLGMRRSGGDAPQTSPPVQNTSSLYDTQIRNRKRIRCWDQQNKKQ